MKVYACAVFLLLLALGWSGCQADERTEIASLQKQVAALTRQVEETRTSLARVQDQQHRIDSSVQKLHSTLATFEQLTQAPKTTGVRSPEMTHLLVENGIIV